MSEPTPTPWEAGTAYTSDGWNVYGPDTSKHANPGEQTVVAEGVTKADATLIVKAVNAHADLVAALERVRLAVDGSGEISHQEARRIIDAALEKSR